jgi:hypothetical protein
VIKWISKCMSKQYTFCFNHGWFTPIYLYTVIKLPIQKVLGSRCSLVENKSRSRMNIYWELSILTLQKHMSLWTKLKYESQCFWSQLEEEEEEKSIYLKESIPDKLERESIPGNEEEGNLWSLI